MVVGIVVLLPTGPFSVRLDFFLSFPGRDNVLGDAGWFEATRIAALAMLSCLTSLRERWKIVAFSTFCKLSSLFLARAVSTIPIAVMMQNTHPFFCES